MIKERIEDRAINYVVVRIHTENGCNPSEGEYTIYLCGLIGELDLSSPGEGDDISLIKEAIENDLDFDVLPKEGVTEIILKESGEMEDVVWHKYYTIDRIFVIQQACTESL